MSCNDVIYTTDQDKFYQSSAIWQGVLYELLRNATSVDEAIAGADKVLAAFKKAVQ